MGAILTQIATVVSLTMLGLLTAAAGGWGLLALIYSGPHSDTVRYSLATAFGVISLVALIALGFRDWRWRALIVYLMLFAVVVA